MKIPSLFTKAPTYQRFQFKPRYYDPAKEERLEREKNIRAEIERENGKIPEETPDDYRSRLKGSFHAARRRSKPAAEPNVVIIRLAVLLFLSLFLIAFFTWGTAALYSLFLFFPVYFYFKFFRRNK